MTSLPLTPVPEAVLCAACPRELTGQHKKWCSEYCRHWAEKNPGQRQAVARPIVHERRKAAPVVAVKECEAGCGKQTQGRFCSHSCRAWIRRNPGQRRADVRANQVAQFKEALTAYNKLNGINSDTEIELAERLGRMVRDCWRAWAWEQSSPKESWLVPWEQLSGQQKEVNRRIGLALYRLGRREAQSSGE